MPVAKRIATPLSESIPKINTAHKTNIGPTLITTQQSYDCGRNKIIFCLTNIEDNIFEKKAGEIALSASMVAALPADDILLVGYVAGMEHSEVNTSTNGSTVLRNSPELALGDI